MYTALTYNALDLPNAPFYGAVPFVSNEGGVLSLVSKAYGILMGRKQILDSFKWRKFCKSVLNISVLEAAEAEAVEGKTDRTCTEGSSNDTYELLRQAEELYRKYKRENEQYQNSDRSEVLVFMQMCVEWTLLLIQNLRHLKKNVSLVQLLTRTCNDFIAKNS